jgi:hypothetical protein
MKKLTDEELIELAIQEFTQYEESTSFDVPFYQQIHSIIDGKNKVYLSHLYYHYKKWSIDPVEFRMFCDTINIKRRTKDAIFIDKAFCTIDLDKNLGNYVKSKKNRKKETRVG